MNVVPGWFALALLIATVVMLPAIMRRWHSLRGGRRGGPPHSLFDTVFTVITHLWLPAVVLAVPLVYVVRLLFSRIADFRREGKRCTRFWSWPRPSHGSPPSPRPPWPRASGARRC